MDPGEASGYGECRACAGARRVLREQRVAAQPSVQVRPGDTVAITVVGRRYVGRVDQATDWGRDAGWYVEFHHVQGGAGRPGDPGYWKCGEDGGVLEVLTALSGAAP